MYGDTILPMNSHWLTIYTGTDGALNFRLMISSMVIGRNLCSVFVRFQLLPNTFFQPQAPMMRQCSSLAISLQRDIDRCVLAIPAITLFTRPVEKYIYM